MPKFIIAKQIEVEAENIEEALTTYNESGTTIGITCREKPDQSSDPNLPEVGNRRGKP